MADFARLYLNSAQLLTLHDTLEDEIGLAMTRLLGILAQPEADEAGTGQAYANLFRELSAETELYPGQTVGNAWQNHLLDRLLASTGPAARKARLAGSTSLSGSQKAALRHDLQCLQELYRLDGDQLLARVRRTLKGRELPYWGSMTGLGPPAEDELNSATRQLNLKRSLAAAEDWTTLLPELLDYYRQYDSSDFARYRALRWVRTAGAGRGGQFEPVLQVDQQSFEKLIGYERERQVIIDNTEQFLAGHSANHVLLYGARGTGKSSTVKALLPRYAAQGLRLVEVHKSDLDDYPLIAQILRGRPEKFILFVDDLSFEAEEFSYKDLKALLEGSLEARPANLLIYATSNRRHLIKEQFGDNARLGDDEVNAWDTVEEKLSLSDRFGLQVTFLSPTQQQYLAIVAGLAQQMGITLEAEELSCLALRWELSHSGRSGRTARQFVDHLAGKLRLHAL